MGGCPLSSTAAFDQAQNSGFVVRAGRDAELTFRRARRHSRHVRILRKAIPVVVVVLIVGTALLRWVDPLRVLSRLPASSEGVVISGTKITMAAPKLSGYTKDMRRYEMTALSAMQDVTKPDVIELNSVRAAIEAADKSKINIFSTAGLYDRKSGMLTLNRDVKITSTTGYDIRLDEAVINTANNQIVSDKPVEVKSQQGTIKAQRLEVESGGEVVHFIGAVNVYIPPSAPGTAQKAADKP